jgi:hypothetical protein
MKISKKKKINLFLEKEVVYTEDRTILLFDVINNSSKIFVPNSIIVSISANDIKANRFLPRESSHKILNLIFSETI